MKNGRIRTTPIGFTRKDRAKIKILKNNKFISFVLKYFANTINEDKINSVANSTPNCMIEERTSTLEG